MIRSHYVITFGHWTWHVYHRTPFLSTWVIVSSTETTWKRLKAGRPSRPEHYVSHQDKVIRIWAVKIMSSPQEKRSRGDGLAQSGTSGIIGSKGLYWAESSVCMRSWAVGKTKLVHQRRNSKGVTKMLEKAPCFLWELGYEFIFYHIIRGSAKAVGVIYIIQWC